MITGRERRASWLPRLGVSLAWERDTFQSLHAQLGWGYLSFLTFTAVSGVSVGWDLVKHKLCPVGQQWVGQRGPSGVSVGSCCQPEGCLLLGVAGSFYPFYIPLTTRWRHRLILGECNFHCGNNHNPPFSATFPPGLSQFTYRVYKAQQTCRI